MVCAPKRYSGYCERSLRRSPTFQGVSSRIATAIQRGKGDARIGSNKRAGPNHNTIIISTRPIPALTCTSYRFQQRDHHFPCKGLIHYP
jgi:hypothetical protein